MAIVGAILEGERDPRKLAKLADKRVKATKQTIAKSLEGNWRPELLFVLEQELALYQMYRGKIEECGRKLEQHLHTAPSKVDPEAAPIGPRPKGKRAQGNAPRFDIRSELYRISGVDWARVNGIDVQVAQTVIAEAGPDLRAFPSERHFSSWLGYCATNETSGGRVLKRRTRHVVNPAAVAFRQAASSLIRSNSCLGAKYRRLRARLGAPKAITAMARQSACLFHRLITKGQQYVDKGMEYYEQRFREQRVRLLRKKARQLGFEVIQPDVEAA
jgi:transposase